MRSHHVRFKFSIKDIFGNISWIRCRFSTTIIPISFRISDAERKQIEARILASGMMKKDYFVRSCIYNRICVVGKKEAIYPLVQTVNALYLQLLEMQKAFAEYCEHQTLNNLPTSDEIQELQTDYNNMLTAIIDLLYGAKYLWEGEHHETK